MTPEEQAVIFDRFVQASAKTYHEYGGSGLGLYICKGLVELMGGEIHVKSKQWEGSTFSFTLPFELASSDQTGTAVEKVTSRLRLIIAGTGSAKSSREALKALPFCDDRRR